MKKMIVVMAATALFAACRNQDKTAAETENAKPAPVVVEKKVYVPVQTQPATTQQKKGWSKAAKGAAIGAGTGALVGVAVSDKKGKGAIIGGVVGAGAGYLIGRDRDKKDGRVKPKN